MVICAAVGCNSRSDRGNANVSFFRFPSDKQLEKLWIRKIGRGNGKGGLFEPTKNHRLCSLHFEESDFVKSKSLNFLSSIGFTRQTAPRLNDHAVPTIFSHKRVQPARMSASSIEAKRRRIEIVHSCSSNSELPSDEESIELDLDGPLTATPLHNLSDLNTLASVAADQRQVSNTTSFSVQSQTPKWQGHTKHVQAVITTEDQGCQTDWENDVPNSRSILQLPKYDCPGDISFSELTDTSFREEVDESDESWTVDSDSEESDSEEEDELMEAANHTPTGERKFVVFESQLDKLMKKCRVCSGNISVTKVMKGALLSCKLECKNCVSVDNWSSQPVHGLLPLGHVELAAAVMFSGSSPVKFLRALQFAGIQVFKPGVYFKIQRLYLSPAIDSVWTNQKNRRIQEIVEERRGVKLGGDARCCSPGHTAKFGSYSVMDLEKGHILDIQLVQSNEVKNSYAMELEGLKRSLAFLAAENVLVTHLVTDRHSSVKKFMREENSDIIHWFDVWHVAKGVYKKLEAAGKKTGCEKVHSWARSVSNHLYWCAATSNGNGELVKQKWLSIMNHVTNVHEGHGDLFPRCQHGVIKKKWMKKGFKPYAELEKVVEGRLLVNDVKKLSPAEQTSSLEAFHKVVNSFVPKSTHYQHANMEARLFLAGMHFNENCNRQQRMTTDGRLQFSISYPKGRKGEPIAKEVKTDQTFGYVNVLMREVLGLRECRPSYNHARNQLLIEGKDRPVPLAQSTPRRLTKEQVIDQHVSRFNRSQLQ